MALELYNTSAPRGLSPGSTGFCTVAHTKGMSQAMIQKLESLGGYLPLYDVGSPEASNNPVAYAHWRMNIGGRFYSILSRVCYAGTDHQGRFNRLAYHLVVDPSEQVEPGPAWAMLQAGVMEQAWSGEPRIISTPKPIPQSLRQPRVCDKWEELAHDAGWAGVLANAFVADQGKVAYVIYKPGMDVLSLAEEAISLVPVDSRWRVTFNTYFDMAPAGLSCAWRFVVAGTPAAKAARGNATSNVIIDLTNPLGKAPDNKYVHAARTGNPVADDPDGQTQSAGSGFPAADRSASHGVYALEAEDPATDIARQLSNISSPRRRQAAPAAKSRWWLWLVVFILWTLVLVGVGFVAYHYKPTGSPTPAPTGDQRYQPLLQEKGNLEKTIENLNKKLAEANGKIAALQQQLATNTSKPPPLTATPTPAPKPTPSPSLASAMPVPEIVIAQCPKWLTDAPGVFSGGHFEPPCPSAARLSMTLTASLPKSFSLIPNQDNTKVSLKGAPEGNGAPTPIELGYAEIKEGNVGWRWVNVTGNAPSSKDCKATYDLVAKARIDVFKENKKNSVPVLTIFFTPGQPGKDTPVSVTWPQPPPKSGWPNVAERKAKEDKLILQVEKDASKEFQQQAVWTFEKHEDEKDKLYHLKWVAPTSMPSEGDFLKFRNWLDIAVQGASLTIGNVGDETPRAIMPPVHLAPEAVTESNGVAIPLADHFPWALVPPALEGSPSPVWSPRPGANKTTIEFDRAGTTLVAEFNSDSAGKPRISVSWKEKGSPDALKQNLIDSWRLRDSKLPQERKTAQNALDTAIAQQTKAQEKRDQAQGALKDAKEKQVNCQSEVSKTGVPVLEDELNKTTNDLNKAPKDLEGAPKEIPQLQNELKDPKLAPKDRAQKTQRFRYLENLWKNKKTAISDLQKQVSDLKQRIVDTKKDQEYDKKQAALTTANQKVEQAQQTFDKIEKELPGFQAHVTEAQTQLSDLTKKENTNVGSIKTTEDNLGQFAVASQLEFNIKADKTGALLAVVRIDVPKVEVPSDPKEPKKDQGDGK